MLHSIYPLHCAVDDIDWGSPAPVDLPAYDDEDAAQETSEGEPAQGGRLATRFIHFVSAFAPLRKAVRTASASSVLDRSRLLS